MTMQKQPQPSLSTQDKPNLVDFLNDPVVQQVMQSDGVTIDDIDDLFTAVRKRLLAQRWRSAA